MNWIEAVVALAVSFGISWIAVSFSIRLSKRWNALDFPDGGRKTQATPIPRLGGVAIAVVMTLLVLGAFAVTNRLGLALALQVLIPALLAAVVGFVDDRRHLNPYFRLALQAGIGVIAWIMGSRVEVTGSIAVNVVITIVWVMILVNAINLLDNSDGLAASTILIMAAAASVIAFLFGQALVALFGVTLMGVSLGYLRHNWHPARVYMGDSGAYFLGTLMALLLIRLTPSSVPQWIGILMILLIAALPILDMSFVVVRRIRAGVHPFTAGRDHLSHELQSRGRSVPVSVASLQIIALLGSVGAILLVLPWA